MLADEAKLIAKKNAWQRLKILSLSGSGVLAFLALSLAGYTLGRISGYNETPRVVIAEPVAAEYRKTLDEARKDIAEAVKLIGFYNIPDEGQRRLFAAIQKMKLVEDALIPSEDDSHSIIIPKFSSMLVTPAYAQAETPRAIAKEDFRQNLAMGLLVAITLFWLFCLGMYFFSKDEKKISFSANMIQTVLGFYIGVFTGLMGLPSAG